MDVEGGSPTMETAETCIQSAREEDRTGTSRYPDDVGRRGDERIVVDVTA